MAGLLDYRRAAVGRGRGDFVRRPGVSVVARACDGQHRQLELRELVPDRREHSLAAVRRSSASERWSCESRPGRCASTSASDWSANSGCRSHSDTTSSIDAASIHEASRSSASARSRLQRSLLDAGRGPDEHHPVERLGRAQRGSQREPPAKRIAHEDPALPRLGDLSHPTLEAVLDVVEHPARIAFGQELRDRPPGVATLHKARDEEHHRSSMIPINRTYAPLQAFVEELYRCGMRHAVTSPGSRNAPLALTPRGSGGSRGCVRSGRALGRFRGARHGEGERTARGRHVHLGHGSGQPPPRRGRGLGGPRPADRAHRRPPAGAARGGRRAGHRPDQALRQRRQVVRGGGHPRPGPRDRRPPPRPGLPRLLDFGRWPPWARCTSTSRCASRSRPRQRSSRPPTGRAARTERPGPSCASTPARRTRTTCTQWRRAWPPSRAG